MAGKDLPPRQKMIGLMYLVLLALLALNVSKDILDAFLLVNNGLKTTITNYTEKNQLLYNEFDKAKLIDPEKVTPYWKNANEAKKLAQDMIDYVRELKVTLIMKTEEIPKEIADTLPLESVGGKDNYDIPTRLMIGELEDGSGGLARELKVKLQQYEKALLDLLQEKERKDTKLDLKTDNVMTTEGIQNWEMGNFYHTPLAATITLLTKVQTDAKNAEFEVVNKLFQAVRKNDFTFDTIAPKVISTSNYVLLGQPYDADIFVAAFSKTQNPEIVIGKLSEKGELIAAYDTLNVKNGMGKYSFSPTSEGIHQYEGIIKITSPSGIEKKYPFRSEFIAAKPQLVVSPDAMNVMYIGPDNPVSISVPGIAAKDIKATITGTGNRLVKTSNGKYRAMLTRNSPRMVRVNVSAITPNGTTKNMGNMEFKVKRLPNPYASFSGISGSASVSLNQIKSAQTLKVTYGPDFLFQGITPSVKSYNVSIRRGNIVIHEKRTNRKQVHSKTATFFKNNLRKKDVIFIEKIMAQDVSGASTPVNGIIKITVR